MDKEPEAPEQTETPQAGTEEPPPFDPDPRIVTYLERGAKPEKNRRFRELVERRIPRED